VLERKKKAVLLLNRRGFASFLLCRECGCVPECPHCATSLTYHERTHELMCHSCGRTWSQTAYPNPMAQCPVCGSKYLAQMGMGTQRVEDELKLAWPELEVFRMDADTTKAKGAHQAILEAFDAAECGVLVGTQMIAKGLDFPSVTLVGAINADTSLKLPDFRAAERTFTLLEQVAGRAGRASEPGHVVIQTFWAGHPVFGAIAAHDERLFVPGELEERKSVGYPPYVRLSNVTFTGTQEAQVERVATAYAAALRAAVSEREGWKVLGPAPCERARLRDRWRWHVMLKSPVGISPAHELAAAAEGVRAHGVSIAIDIDAYDLA
jgi:primosomal protein N' (replication factor Y)